MGIIREIIKNRYLYVLALPGILFLCIFAYIPIIGHLIAFKKFQISKGIFGSPWVGFDNFKFFFQGDEWIKVTVNTLFLNFLFISFGLTIAVTLAILLNEITSQLYKKITQSLIFLPYFISWLVVSLMVFAMLNTSDGLINHQLVKLGMKPVSWYNKPEYWRSLLTLIYIWKFSGYNSVIFLSAITGLSSDYYESARIDGANKLQQIWHITLPLLRPTIIIMGLLGIGRIFYGDFGMIYGIIGDNSILFPTTDVIDTFSYRALRQLGNFSMASSVILYQSVLGLITIVIFNSFVKKIDHDAKLF